MNMTAIYAPLAIVCLGIWLFAAGLKRPRRPRRLGRASFRNVYFLTGGLILAAAGVLLVVRGLNLQTYTPFSENAPVAEVAVKGLYPVEKTYTVTVMRLADGKHTTSCILRGERWAVSGTIQRWHWWSFGPRETFNIQNISSSLDGKTTEVCNIAIQRPKIDYYLPGSLVRWLIETSRAEERPVVQRQEESLTAEAAYTLLVSSEGFSARTDKSSE